MSEVSKPVRKSAAANVLTVMSGTFSSRILGLLRQTLFSQFDTRLTDAFNVAYNIPNLFRELLAEGALSNSIIPVYKKLEVPQRKDFIASFMAFLIFINALVVTAGILLAPMFVDLMVATNSLSQGKSVLDVELAVFLTRLLMPFLAGISLSALAMGLLNAEERFGATAFAPLAFNLVTILGLLVFPNNALMLGVMTSLGGLAQLLVQLPSLRRFGLLVLPRFSWHQSLSRALALMAPFAFTTSTRQFLTIILTGLLAGFGAGTITGFRNAEIIFLTLQGLFALSPATAAYPRFSEYAAQKNWDAFRETVMQYARLVLFLSVGVGALLWALAPNMTSVIFELPGKISDDKFNATLSLLPSFALAIAPWGLVQLLTRAFYARERSRDAVIISTIAFALNTFLYIALAPQGIVVMNFATAITGWLMVGVYVGVLHVQIGLNYKKLVGHTIKVGLAALGCFFAAQLVSSLLPSARSALNGILHCVVAGGIAGVVYLLLCVLLRVPEVERLTRRLRR
ncbi:MAG: murein biosynthesis integral membrane protein MurJ [Deinococcales bacterium]